MPRPEEMEPAGQARRRAAVALEEILESRAPADRPLRRSAAGLTDADRRFLFELVLGTVRWLRRLDWVIGAAARRPVEEIEDRVRTPLRLAAYQLLFLDRVPAYAAVDEAVKEVSRRGKGRAKGFANAVLRRIAEKPDLDKWPVSHRDEAVQLAIASSHPDFLVRRWLRRFGMEKTQAVLDANNRRRPMHLLCFGDRFRVAEELEAEGIVCRAAGLSSRGLRVERGDPLASQAFRRGEIYVQDDASQAAALVPPPARDERVLDIAAAPGGKGFTLTSSEGSIRLLSADRSFRRLLTLRGNSRRIGTDSRLTVADGCAPPFAPVFDRVVIDVPCSGTGTLSRHPELKWRLSEKEIHRLSARGEALLEACSGLVRPGGLVSFISCSIEAEENEGVVSRLLERRSEFSALSLEGRLPPELAAGVEDPGRWRVLPTSEHDGFTVHVIRRGRSGGAG